MFTGSFRLAAGTRHLHRDCNFTELLVETALKSLRHSCRSELTRQGISLALLLLRLLVALLNMTEALCPSGPIISVDLCMSPCSPDHILPTKLGPGVWSL